MLKKKNLFHSYFCLLVLISVMLSCSSEQLTISSPDGAVQVTVTTGYIGEGGTTEAGSIEPGLAYSVSFRGEIVLDESPVRLYFRDGDPLGTGLVVLETETRMVDEEWERVWGKSKKVRNHFNELVIRMKEESGKELLLNLIIRAYDDGIAFRYYIPEQEGIADFELGSEITSFRFTADHKIWATNLGSFHSSQEHIFDETRLSALSEDDILGTPLLVKTGESGWAAILEANLTDWAGMFLSGQAGSPNTVRTKLSPWPDEPDLAVRSKAPRYSPWRVVMLADHPGRFIESDILHNLNDACAIEDVSWIQPGKSAWDWWWNDGYAPDMGRKLGPDTESHKYFIDFASEMGWDYQLVDWHWYGPPFVDEVDFVPRPDADITRYSDICNIPEIVEYAGSKGVKTLIWLQWYHADRQMEEAFPLYEKWGVSGVKIDFMDRNDQQMVNFYHRVVKLAARHHLHVDFHGAYMPTGISRTWPNFLTREGVLGNEYNKWSDRITLDHCLTLPFTRMLGGHMDFTPGGFVHGTRESFKVATESGLPYTMVRGTRCLQLAMFVIYESALQVICDSPYNYRKQPGGLDFLRIVPVTWDETIVLNGEVGDYITIARRSGEEWFIGCMTDWTGRELELSLDFLGEGSYSAQAWADAPDADQHPEKLVTKELVLTKADHYTAQLAPGGGQVIHLVPDRSE